MKEDHEVINDEELKRFFLNEALLLCPSARLETEECEKLWILRTRIKRMNKLLGMLHNQKTDEYLAEIQEAFGFYFMERVESKKKKLKMNDHLGTHTRFVNRMTRSSDLISHYYLYGIRHLKALDRVMNLYFPDDFQKKQQEETQQQEIDRAKIKLEK